MTSFERRRVLAAPLLAAAAFAAVSLLVACTSNGTGPGADFDLEPFKAMARQASCAEVRNRLFLVDGDMVLAQQGGNCPDNSYSHVLYGHAVDERLCVLQDSIMGPQKYCTDPSRAALFEIMIAHPDDPDLGLGTTHSVEPIPF